jgi:hypothetical protein
MILIIAGITLIVLTVVFLCCYAAASEMYDNHVKRTQDLYETMDWNCRAWGGRKRTCSIQKMNAKTFISTYPLMKDYLDIDALGVNTYAFKLNNPKDNVVYFLTFDVLDYLKVHYFCDNLAKLKEEEKKDKERVENHEKEIQMYEFLQSLCQDKMKQAQKEIEVACDDIKEITLRINGIKEE